jgi:nitrogen fixation protein NifQ
MIGMIAVFREPSEFAASSAFAVPQACSRAGDGGLVGATTYRALAGCDAADARIDDDASFDRHIFASILAAAAMDGDAVAELAGLTADQLSALFARYFPQACELASTWCAPAADAGNDALDDEVTMVRDLLLANRSTAGDAGRWLAAMIARRSMQPNHLWEDLGLRERPELTRLLTRHFAFIAARNAKNMRWKRFFYRMLCEDDGLVMCSTPVCTQCRDFDLCFGDESGESRLAYQRRQFELQAIQLSERSP